MPFRLLYYVSGHGFGHARRSAEVIRAVLERSPEAEVTVRTSAAPRLFEPLAAQRVERSELDAGMAEDGPLVIHARATLDRLVRLVRDAGQLVADEVGAVRRLRPDVILADVPFLAGEVAAAAGVPCLAVSNFTWDWICDPLLAGEPAYAALRARMAAGYARMTTCLQLPFGGVSDAFGHVVPTPLVAGRSRRGPAETLARLSLPAGDPRPRVLIGLRGGLPADVIRAAAADAGDYVFLMPGDAAAPDLPPNVLPVPAGSGVEFADLVGVSDVVMSKLGYGIVSDCIAAGTRLLWPRRSGFREDDVVERDGPAVLRMGELRGDALVAGRWRDGLNAIMSLPDPPRQMATDGADRVADYVVRFSAARR